MPSLRDAIAGVADKNDSLSLFPSAAVPLTIVPILASPAP